MNQFFTGELNERIEIQQPASTLDSVTNASVPGWSDSFSRMAKRIQKGSRSVHVAHQQQEERTIDYLVRYDPETKTINNTMRIVNEDKEELYVLGTDPNRREGYVIIKCEQRL
jgi:SPP1 family predicted phage head-tail adaptor